MLNIGIIGFGKMGQIRAEAINSDGRGKIVSVHDAIGNVDFKGYPVAHSIDEIVNDQKIDTVFICTPNYLNKSITISSLSQGKNVFCEKPPAFSEQEVKEIRKVEKQSGKKLMYGFNHRHHRSISDIKKMVDSNEYGKILWMRGRYGKSVDKTFFDNWRSKKEFAGGGILLDQGIHMLDLFMYLSGDFHEVHAMMSNCYWKLDIEDNVFAILKNNNTGIVAQLHSTMTQWRHLFSLEVFLERGYFVLNGLKTKSGTYGDEVLTLAKNRSSAPMASWEDEERITYHVDKSWRSEINMFFDCIINNTQVNIGNSDDALKLMRLVDKLYKNY